MTLDLRSNVVKQKYTFELVFRDERANEMTIIEAESLESAKLKLPSDIMAAKLREIDGKPAVELTEEEYRWMRMPK